MHSHELFDTHCHIQSAGQKVGERYTRQLWSKVDNLSPEAIVAAARQAKVTRMLCVGCDVIDSRLAVETAQRIEGCWSSVGIHPHEAEAVLANNSALEEFAGLADQPKVVAIGESGLDYHYDHSKREAQRQVLEIQIKLAKKHKLPMVFHVREAFEDFWRIFDQYSPLSGVVHSFTDSLDNMKQALERGLYIGVNGISTFTKSPDQLDVYARIPLNRLVLETDAPFLTPNPYRGSINEPKRLIVVADFLAELRGEESKRLISETTKNARQLFGV